MKKISTAQRVSLTAFFYTIAIAGALLLVNSCSKSKETAGTTAGQATDLAHAVKVSPAVHQNAAQTKVVTIANIRKSADGSVTNVMFNQLAEIFTVYDATLLTNLQDAFKANKTIQITFDPWQATVLRMTTADVPQGTANHSAAAKNNAGTAQNVNLAVMSDEAVDNLPQAAVLNTTTTGLTNVVPDMATAQMMFDFIAHQACALSGPYGIDQCISFQYCEDGCYARAHKMCWIINNKYHYDTHKIFSFALGSDQLSVKAEKWGGCCINWWFHVAPLVNVKTPTGTKAFVFDPAMFDQPVLLSTWLHAQENPACASPSNPAHVTKINLQPTASYTPADGTGTTFDTDPMYTSTNSTMVTYGPLKTCP